MDQGSLIALVVVVVVAGIVFILASLRRQPGPADDVDLDAIPFGSALLTGILLSWAGFTVLGKSAPLGVFMLAVGGVALVLAARMGLARRSSVDRPVPNGELSRPAQDYLVWIALGLPMLMGAAFVVLAIAGALGRR